MDNDFITRIYNDYYNMVKMVITSQIYSKNIDDITSCVHDVYITAMKKEGLETHPSIDGWLYLTAKNVAKRFNKKHLTELNKTCDIDDIELPDGDFTEDLIDKLDTPLEKEELLKKRILDNLTDMEKDFYVLKYIKKLPNEEIGEILGITTGSANTRNMRLKAKIRKLVHDYVNL